jgi:hypothetical protein
LDFAVGCGLTVELFRVINFERVHPELWLRWIMVLKRPKASAETGENAATEAID